MKRNYLHGVEPVPSIPPVLTGHHPALDQRTTADIKVALGFSALKKVKRALGCSKAAMVPKECPLR